MLPEFQILILAMAPLSELNVSIPMGLVILNLPFWKVFLISFFGNLIPVVVILVSLEPIANFLSTSNTKFFVWGSTHFEGLKKFFNWLFQRTRKKIQPKIGKYGKIGLVSFIALPMPLTGGWTGALAAFLIGIPFKSSFLLISLGILINGIIVSALTFAGITVEKYFGWQTLIIILAIIISIYFYSHIRPGSRAKPKN